MLDSINKALIGLFNINAGADLPGDIASTIENEDDIQETQPSSSGTFDRLDERLKVLEEKDSKKWPYLVAVFTLYLTLLAILVPLYYGYFPSIRGEANKNKRDISFINEHVIKGVHEDTIKTIIENQKNMLEDIKQNKMYIHDQQYRKQLIDEMYHTQKAKNKK